MSDLNQAEFPFIAKPAAAVPLVPPKPPLVPPKQLYPAIPLNNSRLPEHEQVKVENPAAKFCEDRFANLTIDKQLDLLVSVVMKLQEMEWPQKKPPLTLACIWATLDPEFRPEFSADRPKISAEMAKQFFLHFPHKLVELYLMHEIRNPEVRQFVVEKFLDDLRGQLAAISFTLAQIYSGGFYGLLTARGGRDDVHSSQLETIGRIFGHNPIAELTYYVNDQVLSQRFQGRFDGTASRKVEVLTNFACGLKQDENGRTVRMRVGKRFDEIIFIDDEDSNLKEAFTCLIRSVSAQVQEKIGLTFRSTGKEEELNRQATLIMEREFAVNNADRAQDPEFWISLVGELTSGYRDSSDNRLDAEQLIAELRSEGRWMPDVVKIFHAERLNREPSIETLRAIFEENRPFVMGSRNSVVFDDIDGTLLNVRARFYVIGKDDPGAKPRFAYNQKQYSEERDFNVWIRRVASEQGLSPDDLKVSMDDFYDKERVDLLTFSSQHDRSDTMSTSESKPRAGT